MSFPVKRLSGDVIVILELSTNDLVGEPLNQMSAFEIGMLHTVVNTILHNGDISEPDSEESAGSGTQQYCLLFSDPL